MRHVLAIDDEEIYLKTIEFSLVSKGFRVNLAQGGIEGLAQATALQDTIDIILLDMMMPDLYGLDVLKGLKENPALAPIPVLIVSGLSVMEEIDKAIAMGAKGFLPKPFSRSDLIAAIEKVLAGSGPL